MTEYTFRADAEAFIERIQNASSDLERLDLEKQLRDRHVSIAASAQMLAESNEKWANTHRSLSASVETIIERLADEFEGDINGIPEALVELADLFDVSLDQKVEFTGTISISGTINKPRSMSVDAALAKITISNLDLNTREWDSGVTIEDSDYWLDSVDEA